MKPAPFRVPALSVTPAGPDGVTVGAMVRQADAERDGDVARLAPLVSRAIPLGHFPIGRARASALLVGRTP